eukprot:1148655-Pelagomonas_calceolata.AAC.1
MQKSGLHGAKELQAGDKVRVKMSENPMPTINRTDLTGDWFDSLDRRSLSLLEHLSVQLYAHLNNLLSTICSPPTLAPPAQSTSLALSRVTGADAYPQIPGRNPYFVFTCGGSHLVLESRGFSNIPGVPSNGKGVIICFGMADRKKKKPFCFSLSRCFRWSDRLEQKPAWSDEKPVGKDAFR